MSLDEALEVLLDNPEEINALKNIAARTPIPYSPNIGDFQTYLEHGNISRRPGSLQYILRAGRIVELELLLVEEPDFPLESPLDSVVSELDHLTALKSLVCFARKESFQAPSYRNDNPHKIHDVKERMFEKLEPPEHAAWLVRKKTFEQRLKSAGHAISIWDEGRGFANNKVQKD
ncbi:MAG: hypothetical protein ACFFAS_11860 [Promethearchaeota archaeon]